MGLDMYLKASKSVSGYNHSDPDKRGEFFALLNVIGLAPEHSRRCNTPSATVSVIVAYWRKANQIHKWFVDKVQKGTDDCGIYYVERSQLEELVATCKEVLNVVKTVEGAELAASKLPTASGFFFGGTDYDEYYLEDLKNTVTMLEAILADRQLNDWDFEYHASW